MAVKRWLYWDRMVELIDYGDGDKNFRFAFFLLGWQWPPKLGTQRWKYDGLPRRDVWVGPLFMSWGQDHYFECSDD